MEIPFYTIQDKKKTLITKIGFTPESPPALDIGFSHNGKYYKVREVKKTEKSFECIIEETKKPIDTMEHKVKE